MSNHSDDLSKNRRRLLQGMGALPLAGMAGVAGLGSLPGLSRAAAPATSAVNTTKLAVTDTEVIVGQLLSLIHI